MLIKEKVMITPYNLERTLHIYVPDDYEDKRFPVLYMFDGHNLFLDSDASFGKSWGMKEYFDENHIECIVVGIECNHEGTMRLSEFSPYSFYDNEFGEIEGTGKELFKWIIKELKPYIDDNYPTIPFREYTGIGGSSMGGLMALYGGMRYAKYFSKAACLSPHIENGLLQCLKRDIRRTKELYDTSFYISFGRFEYRNIKQFTRGVENNLSLARLLTKKGAAVYPHCYKYGDHSEGSWENEVPRFLKELDFK